METRGQELTWRRDFFAREEQSVNILPPIFVTLIRRSFLSTSQLPLILRRYSFQRVSRLDLADLGTGYGYVVVQYLLQ